MIWLKVEADRCELDAASLESFSSLVYVHLLFDVFTRSGAKKSMPAGIEERRVAAVRRVCVCVWLSVRRRLLIDHRLLN